MRYNDQSLTQQFSVACFKFTCLKFVGQADQILFAKITEQNVDPFTGQPGNKAGLGSGGIGDNRGPHFGIGEY